MPCESPPIVPIVLLRMGICLGGEVMKYPQVVFLCEGKLIKHMQGTLIVKLMSCKECLLRGCVKVR